MTRAYFTIDETDPAAPKACLHVNGCSLTLDPAELAGLVKGAMWAASTCSTRRGNIRTNKLAGRYQAAMPLPAGR